MMIYTKNPSGMKAKFYLGRKKIQTNRKKEDPGNVIIQFRVSNSIIFKIKALKVHNNFPAPANHTSSIMALHGASWLFYNESLKNQSKTICLSFSIFSLCR